MERMGQPHEVCRRQEKQHVVIDRIFRTGRGRFVASGADHPVGNTGRGDSCGENKVNPSVLDL